MKPNQNSQLYSPENCRHPRYQYKSVQINIIKSGNYTLSSVYPRETWGFLYRQHFNPNNPSQRLYSSNRGGCPFNQFKIVVYLQSNLTYILTIIIELRLSTPIYKRTMILVAGPNDVTSNQISMLNILDIDSFFSIKKSRKF